MPSDLVEILGPSNVPEDNEDDLESTEELLNLTYKKVVKAMTLVIEAVELLIVNNAIMSLGI